MQRRTEGAQCVDNAFCICRFWTDPDVQILGCADMTVGGQRVRTNDYVFN